MRGDSSGADAVTSVFFETVTNYKPNDHRRTERDHEETQKKVNAGTVLTEGNNKLAQSHALRDLEVNGRGLQLNTTSNLSGNKHSLFELLKRLERT